MHQGVIVAMQLRTVGNDARGFWDFPGSPAEPSQVALLNLAISIINRGTLSKEAFAKGLRDILQEQSCELVHCSYNQLRKGLTFFARAKRLASV